MNNNIQLFEQKKWYFSIVDAVEVLTESADANAYWRKLRQRLKQEGNKIVTNCHGLEMVSRDGKMRLTDVDDVPQLSLRRKGLKIKSKTHQIR